MKHINSFIITLLSFSSLNYSLADTSIQSTINIYVTSSISPTCHINIDNINFSYESSGSYSGTNSNLYSTCTRNTSYSITFSTGNGTLVKRAMKGSRNNNNDTFSYNLYKNNNYDEILGDGSNNSYTISGVGTGENISVPVYAKPNSNRYITTDDYKDNVIITILY